MHLDLPDGTHTVLEFKGKNIYTKERYTDVEDPQIQKLLEATEAFGVYFERSNEFDWMEAEEKEAQAKAQAEEPSDIQEINESQAGISKSLVFTTGTEAKNWLIQKLGVPSYKLGNKAKMIEEAELLGYTIEFENK